MNPDREANAQAESQAEPPQGKPAFHLGGQALVEGVLMRSPHFVAASVRRADGSIETRVEPFTSILGRSRWLKLPLLRGTVALVEMMLLGTRFLRWSAQVALDDEAAKANKQDAQDKQDGWKLGERKRRT